MSYLQLTAHSSLDHADDVARLALDLDGVADALEQLARGRDTDDLEHRRGHVGGVDLDVRDAEDAVEQRLLVAHVAAAPQLEHVDLLAEQAVLALDVRRADAEHLRL